MPERFMVPPHSREAEQSVIGAVLMDNAALDRIGGLISPDDFYEPMHRAIWGTIIELAAASRAADVVTVHDRGGHDPGYLAALAQAVPSARAARDYAQIVLERSIRRRVMALGESLSSDARDGIESRSPIATRVDQAISELLALQGGEHETEPHDIQQLTSHFIEDIENRAAGNVLTIPTGMHDLDRLTGDGGRPGELWVIGARPSMGKTAFVLTLCRNVGVNHQVLMLTQEDSLMSLTARHVAAAGRVSLSHLRNPRSAPDSMWEGLVTGTTELSQLHIAMDDQPSLSLADVRRKMQQVRRRKGALSLVVIDYLQLMEGEGENRNQLLGAIANGLKRAANEFKCWIVLLSQLNREADKRTGPPQMSDLRDSGDIEGAADLIGLLYREFMRKPKPDNKHLAELHVCKHKNGPTGTLKFFFDGSYQRFADWATDHVEEAH